MISSMGMRAIGPLLGPTLGPLLGPIEVVVVGVFEVVEICGLSPTAFGVVVVVIVACALVSLTCVVHPAATPVLATLMHFTQLFATPP